MWLDLNKSIFCALFVFVFVRFKNKFYFVSLKKNELDLINFLSRRIRKNSGVKFISEKLFTRKSLRNFGLLRRDSIFFAASFLVKRRQNNFNSFLQSFSQNSGPKFRLNYFKKTKFCTNSISVTLTAF